MTEAISEIQVRVGTITSPVPYKIFIANRVSKFAEDPEFTKILCLTPNHCDHLYSKCLTFSDWVNIFFYYFLKN
jgi:hypothetical protein